MGTWIIAIITLLAFLFVNWMIRYQLGVSKGKLLKQKAINSIAERAPIGSTATIVKRKVKDANGVQLKDAKGKNVFEYVYKICSSDSLSEVNGNYMTLDYDDNYTIFDKNDNPVSTGKYGNVTVENIDDNGNEVLNFVPMRRTESAFNESRKSYLLNEELDKWANNFNGLVHTNVKSSPQYPKFLHTMYTHFKGIKGELDATTNEFTYYIDQVSQKKTDRIKLIKIDTNGQLQWNTGRFNEKWENTTVEQVIDELELQQQP